MKCLVSLIGFGIFAGCTIGSSDPILDGGIDAEAVDLRRIHDLTPAPSVTVTGQAVDESGTPIAMAWMSVCTPMGCHSVNADGAGAFLISDIPLIHFGLRSHDDHEVVPRRGTVVRLLHGIQAATTLDAGTLYLPTMPAGADLEAAMETSQMLSTGDGLSLTVIRKNLDFSLASDQTTNLASRKIPVEHIPPFDLGGEKVDTAFALWPYAVTSKSPIAVKVPVDLPSNTKVYFRTVYEFDGKLSDPVVGHVASDGKSASTDPGLGISNLTWLLVSH